MRLMLCALAASFAASAAARAGEEKVPLDKLPKAVVAAVKKRFPGAEMKTGAKEVESGKTVYEVSLQEKGKGVDVSVTEAGEIIGIEKEIDKAGLPKAAAAALGKKYPGAKYKKVEEVVKVAKGVETTECYEALLVTADKKTVEVEVTADGAIKSAKEKTGETDD